MAQVTRGRLLDASAAPKRGERVEQLLRAGNVVIEQIFSGELDGPFEYRQAHDEFVMVMAGGAVLEVDGEGIDLGPGHWLLLPAGTPHRLVRTEPGTNWLAVHLHG